MKRTLLFALLPALALALGAWESKHAATNAPLRLQSAVGTNALVGATNAPPAAPLAPTFADGVRLGAILARRNPDVALPHLLRMAAEAWTAERQRESAEGR